MTHRIALVNNSTCDIPQVWPKKYEIVDPILGVHTGPGAIALYGYSE